MQYRTLSPLNHDGRQFAAGQLIDLTEMHAIQLLAGKAIEPAHKPFGKRIVMAHPNTSPEVSAFRPDEIDPKRLGATDLLFQPVKRS